MSYNKIKFIKTLLIGITLALCGIILGIGFKPETVSASVYSPYLIGVSDCVYLRNASGPPSNEGGSPSDPIRFWVDQQKVESNGFFSIMANAGFNLFRWGSSNCAISLFDKIDPAGNVYNQANAAKIDVMMDAAKANGFKIMYTLFGNIGNPPFPYGTTSAQFSAMHKYIDYVVGRYGPQIDIWELTNESNTDSAWTANLSAYLHSIPSEANKPISTSWEKTDPGIDIYSPHWYQTENEMDSDITAWNNIRDWKGSGKPVIVGEQGNSNCNWDSGSALRMRLRSWTAFFAQGSLIFWNAGAGKDCGLGYAANIYLGSTEFGYIRQLSNFTAGFDNNSLTSPGNYSDNGSVRAYTLSDSKNYAAYLVHYTSHSTTVSGMKLNVNTQFSGTATWINPATGDVVGTQNVSVGTTQLAVPSFQIDVAMKININSTPPPPSDTTAPTISLTVPAGGATVSGTSVTLSANASDNVGVTNVQFKIDGVNFGIADASAPYSVAWDTTGTANGTHTISATARDAAGNIANTSPITVTVNNTVTLPPVCPATVPSNTFLGCYYTGTNFGSFVFSRTDSAINFNWNTASPGTGVSLTSYSARWQGTFTFQAGDYTFNTTADDGVRIYVDNSLILDKWIDQAASFITVKTMTAGVHTIKIEYYQNQGNAGLQVAWAKAAPAPDITAPVVSVAAPAAGTTVSGTAVNLSANASDNVGVASVQFKIDSVNLGSADTSAPYTMVWDTSAAANGAHVVSAVARDAAGNSTTSANVSVIVNNATPVVPPVNLPLTSGIVTVDSNYDGTYGPAVINDDVINATGGAATTWASAGNAGDHYIDFDFTSPTQISGATVYWAYNSYHQEYATASTLQVQAKDGNGDYQTVATMPYTGSQPVSSVTFAGVTTNSLRFLQPANQGSPNYPTVMWVTEADYSTATTPVVPPADSVAPSVSITSPLINAVVSGSAVPILATAQDDVGVASVQFLLDGVNLGALVTAAPYAMIWDTAAVANGNHVLTAIAKDAAGNSTTSAPVNVTVNNIVSPPAVPPAGGGGGGSGGGNGGSTPPVIPPVVPPVNSNLPYLSGSLVNDKGAIFLIRGQYKIGFTNYSAFTGLGYSLKNVVVGSTSAYLLEPAGYLIRTASQMHPWGSFIKSGNTIYYSTQAGMIGIPSYAVFLNAHGNPNTVLPANSFDLSVITSSHLPVMATGDSRVIY